jgi:hypothetical protein
MEAKVLFDSSDADVKLKALVDLVLFKFCELGVDAIDFCRKLVNATVERRDVILAGHVVLDEIRRLKQIAKIPVHMPIARNVAFSPNVI